MRLNARNEKLRSKPVLKLRKRQLKRRLKD
jgi:hypothetical protein